MAPKQPERQPIGLTVDIEDWYHSVLGMPPEEWDRQPDRVVETTETLLQVLADADAHGTFFTSATSPSDIRNWCAASPTPATKSPVTATPTASCTSSPRAVQGRSGTRP